MWFAAKSSPLQILLILLLQVYTTSSCDNCTDDSVTKEELHIEGRSRSTLAWLVTPALFFVGVIFVIYKCCRDGLCNCRRLRQRAAREHQQEHGYIPLSEVAVYASSVPQEGGTDAPGHRQLVLVHNQTFCVTFGNPSQRLNGSHPPSYEESQLHNTGQTSDVQVVTNPPSYISSKPPRYSVAVGEPSPRPSISDDSTPADVIVISERPRQLYKFISHRRRHRSAQDMRMKQDRQRHYSAQDSRRKPLLSDEEDCDIDEPMRQRCFSFNALKDAFSRRSQQNVLECQSLLADEEGTESVFSSREAVSSPGPSVAPSITPVVVAGTSSPFVHCPLARTAMRRPPQQVSFEDRIMEESNENLNSTPKTTHTTDNVQLRQRHFSAPDRAHTQNYKSRHASGNT